MKQKKFAIKPYRNKSGSVSYRLTGWLNDERIRQNFLTRAEAAIEKSALEIRAYQATSGLRPTITSLADEQIRQAETAFQRLKDEPHSLSFCVEYTLSNYRPPNRNTLLAPAIEAYLVNKVKECGQGLLTARQFQNIKNELAILVSLFPKSNVSDLSPSDIIAYLERGSVSLKTYNNRRAYLSIFFKYALQQDWIASNPIEKTPHHRIRHRRGTADALTPEGTAELMAYVEHYANGALVPFFALCLFAGIRPSTRDGEITKLKPSDINFDSGVIHIEPDVSKVRMKRLITIQPNLSAWLRAYPLSKFPIIVPNLEALRTHIAKRFNLSHDVLRHTFISMHVAKFRSMGDTALQAGNSEAIIRKHYLDVKSREEGEAFFDILPLCRSRHMPQKASETDAPQDSANNETMPAMSHQLAT